MGDGYLLRCYGRSADGPPPATVAHSLLHIWCGALYRLTPEQLRASGR